MKKKASLPTTKSSKSFNISNQALECNFNKFLIKILFYLWKCFILNYQINRLVMEMSLLKFCNTDLKVRSAIKNIIIMLESFEMFKFEKQWLFRVQ